MSKKKRSYREEDPDKITWEDIWSLIRPALPFVALLFSIWWLGKTSEEQDRREAEQYLHSINYDPTEKLGVEPVKMPTRFLHYTPPESNCLPKDEFYEGMEDAEMRGMDDDASAQDIYDVFNR